MKIKYSIGIILLLHVTILYISFFINSLLSNVLVSDKNKYFVNLCEKFPITNHIFNFYYHLLILSYINKFFSIIYFLFIIYIKTFF